MSLQTFEALRMPRPALGRVVIYPPWTPADGPAPFVWDWMPPGSKFLGAYLVSTAHGLMRPRDYGLGSDDLSAIQLAVCLQCWIDQGRCFNRAAEVHGALAQLKKTNAVVSIAKALHYDMSEGCLEVVAPWDRPAKVMVDFQAPGWDKLKAAV